MSVESSVDYAAFTVESASKDGKDGLSDNQATASDPQLKKLLKEMTLLSPLMEVSLDGIIIGDPNGNIYYVNQAVPRMLGGKKEDYLGKNLLQFVVPREQKRALELSLRAMRSGEAYISEFVALNKDGMEVSVEVAAAVVKDKDQAIGFIDIVRDVSDRKKVDDRLKKQAALIDLSPSAIIIKKADGEITFWSRGAEKLYGFSKEEALGQKIDKLIGGSSLDSTSEIYNDLKQGRHWVGELVHRTKGDKEVVVQADLLAILDGKGCVSEVLESITDITAHKRAEEAALRVAEERYLKAERLAAIGQLAGMVGHDLRNPLAGIKNAVYLLRKKQGDFIGEEGLRMLNTISSAVAHADSIINDLLDYSRDVHLEVEEYSSKSLINYVILAVKVPTNVRVLERTEDHLLWIDANKIQRVFINLLKNSFDAMPNGGQLEIGSRLNGDFVEFVFVDTGTGMSEEVLSKLFTPLFTTKAQGMGLGLSICKRMIEAHGGKVSVQSTLNVGTKFTVSLPLKRS